MSSTTDLLSYNPYLSHTIFGVILYYINISLMFACLFACAHTRLKVLSNGARWQYGLLLQVSLPLGIFTSPSNVGI